LYRATTGVFRLKSFTNVSQYIGYTRVSTTKQGEGVSLEVQQEAIARYAERNGFVVGLWLEEKETAAKHGRPVFTQVIKLLRERKYKGIILHKLDRGFRNLKEWAEIGELSDQGVEVHFVNESLDLHSRGGRLSADIQAVVAADYIRNLREETRKGFDGRLKQGLYPLRAPIGYLDQGKGKPKAIDPVKGPLVRKGFELYSTGRFSLEGLGDELYRLGLRNHNGGRVTRNGLSTFLNNSFYIGINHIRKTNETFAGIHAPLIGKTLFDRVQSVLKGKVNAKTQRHVFQFRRMLTCAQCGYSLVGELQKGHVYYRCHSKGCRQASLREETLERGVKELLQRLCFSDKEKDYFHQKIMAMREKWADHRDEEIRSARLRVDTVKDRLNRLTDAFLDGAIDKLLFEQRKTGLLGEQRTLEEQLAHLTRENGEGMDRLQKFLELAGSALLSYELAFPEEKREMVQILTSNRCVNGKNVELEPSLPFREIANRLKDDGCDPHRDRLRTLDPIIDSLAKLNAAGELPDLSRVFPVRDKDNKAAEPRKGWKHDENGKFTSFA
jgi:site-specific DNA recombinase